MDRSHYFEALELADILPRLAAFDPHVVGTPPLGLELPTSDIDVICCAPDADAFTRAVWKAFGARPKFRMWQKIAHDRPVVASFAIADWMVEIFGQASPIAEQHAQRHFLVERRLLALGGEPLRLTVMRHRGNGMKTEPAFAEVLDLNGDPYQALLRLECCSDMELISLLRDRGFI
ncbi:DUF4269 domain-containing protein [Sphingopyxis sp.]|uniref:DUF4269 domain-containing protein n=1 Tax=Sphingopyxis sp. TaxID=1908224 RepID=UPI001DE66247|nr:DUF4269 domain-containing protein [Sphingopyxis sp.]MBW8296333.1 DUF4269 domain-containing protein [Sphingopyxis sp.]